MDGDLEDLCMWSTSLTAPIHLDKSPAIASKSRPAWKACLIPLNAAVAVDIAALTVNGSMVHLLSQRLRLLVYLLQLALLGIYNPYCP